MSNDLKLCPFCGNPPQTKEWHQKGLPAMRIFCDECSMNLQIQGIKDWVIEKWNYRPLEKDKEDTIYTRQGWFLHKDWLSGPAKHSFMRFLLFTQGGAESIDIHVRKDGIEYDFEGDFLKHMQLVNSNQNTEAQNAALDKVLIAGNHLASVLSSWLLHPADYRNYDAILHGRGTEVADVWLAWKAIMDLSKEIQTKD